MRQLMAVVGLAVLGFPSVVLAQPVSSGPAYSYLDVGYLDIEGATGIGVEASIEINPMFHASFGLSHVEEGNLEANLMTVAAGYSHPISGTTDWIARAGLARASLDVGFADASETGIMAQTGIRSMVTPSTELNGTVTFVDTFNGETSFGFGAVHQFSDTVGLGASVASNDGDFAWSVGLRFQF